jgi:hypothetical protein
MEVIAIGGKKPSGYLKVVQTDDAEMVLDDLNERSTCELKIKWRTELPEWLEFSDLIDEVEATSDHCIAADSWYETTTYRIKKALASFEDSEEVEKGEKYYYADDERDREFNGEVVDG